MNSDRSHHMPGRAALGTLAALALLASAGVTHAQDGAVELLRIERQDFATLIVGATSMAPRPKRAVYEASALWDGRTWTAWAADEPQEAWIEVHFPTTRYITRIQVLTGDGASAEAWRQTRRARRLLIHHDHGVSRMELSDHPALQEIDFAEPIVSTKLRIVVDGTWGYGPVAVSELAFFEPKDVVALKPQLRLDIEAHVADLKSPAKRERAMIALEAVGAPARPWIVMALRSQDTHTRAAAIELLRRTRTKDGFDGVVASVNELIHQELEQPDEAQVELVRAALRYLGQSHAARGVRISKALWAQAPWRASLAPEIIASLAQSGLPASEPLLREAMLTGDPVMVSNAAPAFARLGQIGLEGLRAVACHEDARVRRGAAEALAYFEQGRPRRLTEKLTHDSNPRVRAAALASLGQHLQPRWVPTLLEMAADDVAEVRVAVATALGALHSEDINRQLVALASDGEREVRLSAVQSLERHGPVAISTLVALAAPGDTGHADATRAVSAALKRYAVQHADMITEQLGARLDGAEAADAQHMANIMAGCGESGARHLLELVKGESTRMAFYALRALRQSPGHVMALLHPELEEGHFRGLDVRLASRYLQLVAASGESAWLGSLTHALEDPRLYVRMELMRTLASFDTPPAHAMLLTALNDDEPDVRAEAATVLGQQRVTAAVGPLIEIIRRNDARLLSAIRALGRIGSPAALPALHDLLGHHRESVRQYACIAIGDIGSVQSEMHLVNVLDDDDAIVRYYAQRALRRLND